MMRKNSAGLALPIAIVILALVGLVGFGSLYGVSKRQRESASEVTIDNKYHGAVHAGATVNEHHILRPDDPTQAKTWTKDEETEETITVNGKSVKVKTKHVEVAP